MDELQRLQRWYAAQCNEVWEHSCGVRIDTLDNPGWKVSIDLAGTALQDRVFHPQCRGDSDLDADWMVCKVESQQFLAYGGANNLLELIRVFVDWADVDHASR